MATTASIKPPRIQALARASAIIDVIAATDGSGVGLSQISKATGLNKTTAFNLLASLVTLGFVDQDRTTRHYRLGLKNLELGRLVQQRLDISHLARPILADLCRHTNETVNLGLPDLYDLLVVDSFRGSQILHATPTAGWRSMYHCTALGKALMASWDEPMRQTIYRSAGLPQKTANTITEVEALEAQLAQFATQGYTLDLEENEIGVNGIGCSVLDGLGEVAAAVSVAGPANRLTQEVMERISPDVIAAADSIAAAIGGREQPQKRVAAGRR